MALDAPCRPGHGHQALWADLVLALHADSKTAVVNPPQRGSDLAQQRGFPVRVPDRQFAFRRILDLIHLIRVLLDGDTVPGSQYLGQFGRCSFENLLKTVQLVCTVCTAFPSRVQIASRPLTRDGPEQTPAGQRLMVLSHARSTRNPQNHDVKAAPELQHLQSRTRPLRDLSCLQNPGLPLWTFSLQCLEW